MKNLQSVVPIPAPVPQRQATGLHLIGDLYGCLCDSRLMLDAVRRVPTSTLPGGRRATEEKGMSQAHCRAFVPLCVGDAHAATLTSNPPGGSGGTFLKNPQV